MGVEYVTNLSDFESITRNSGNKLVVVDFYADWCGPCRAIAPLYDRLANQYAGRARFLKVDVDSAQDISSRCGISAMPTFQFYKRGTRVDEMQGADPGRLQSTVERHAPSSADVSFAGAGHQLGGSSSGGGGPPKVNWDSPAAQDEVRKRREAMAAAASQRYAAPEPKKEDEGKPEEKKAEEAAPSEMKEGALEKPKEGNDVRLKVDDALLKQMLEMGFPQVRAEKALILTGNKSLEPAMEWCFEHSDDPDIDEPLAVVTKEGKAKPGLSEEERKRRANEALLKARVRRAEEEKKEAHDRERNRIRSGKEITEAKRAHEENERKRAIEAKRKEKREAALQKQRIQQLVAADRAARREKFGKKAPAAEPAAPAPAPAAPKQAAPVTGGKLQLRFSDGSRAEPHFEPEHTLADVVDAVLKEKPGASKASVKLSTVYPRRTFEADEYTSTLVDLKLLPRGVLNVSI